MLKRRVTANAIANLFSQLVNAASQVALVPVFLHYWSAEKYGEWIILYSIPGYLALADVGIPTVAANEASMRVAAGDSERARQLIHTAFAILLSVACTILLAAAPISYLVNWAKLLGTYNLSHADLSWCVFLLSAYTVVGLFSSLSTTLYRAADRVPRGIYASSFCRLSELIAIVVVLIFSGTPVAMAETLLAVRIIGCFALYIDTRIIAPHLDLGLSQCSWTDFKNTIKPAFLYMAFPTGNAFYFQGLTLVAGRLFGPATVVVFNSCRALTRAIVQLISVIKQSTMPEFAYLFGAKDLARARRLHALAFEASLLIASSISVVLIIVGPDLMRLWTHGVVVPGRSLIGLFMFSAILNSMWNVSSVLLLGTNRHGQVAVCYLVVTTVALIMGAVFAGLLGLWSLAGCMVLCDAILVPYTLAKVCRELEQPIEQFLRDSLTFRQIRDYGASCVAR